jgi:hypothetical protein
VESPVLGDGYAGFGGRPGETGRSRDRYRAPGRPYGAFNRSALYPLLTRINAYLMRWSRKKYKRLRGRKPAQAQWELAVKLQPRFFAHWSWVNTVPDVW